MKHGNQKTRETELSTTTIHPCKYKTRLKTQKDWGINTQGNKGCKRLVA